MRAAGRPRRTRPSSTTSSWYRVAVWMSSAAQPTATASSTGVPVARAASGGGAGLGAGHGHDRTKYSKQIEDTQGLVWPGFSVDIPALYAGWPGATRGACHGSDPRPGSAGPAGD